MRRPLFSTHILSGTVKVFGNFDLRRAIIWLGCGLLVSATGLLGGTFGEDRTMPRVDEAAARDRWMRSTRFEATASSRAGVLVPIYVYPANIHRNAEFNRLMDLKRRFATVPFRVIVNPASGPGEAVDANFTKAIDRLVGAGCVVLGYVSTSYGRRPAEEATRDIDRWLAMYPRIHGLFFDEMIYEDSPEAVEKQSRLTRHAKSRGLYPLVSNPGTDTPGRYFDADVADTIVIHEGSEWAAEARLKGGFFGGYADHPPQSRGVLVHSLANFDPEQLRMTMRYARWVYITEAPYRVNDPAAANPWDRLSSHLEATCQVLAESP